MECITDIIPSKQYQILESQVLKEGKYAVISQSKDYSIGYSNSEAKVFHHNNPVIIFGDHTAEVKFVVFDFIVGADGVKIFEPKNCLYPKFFFYVMQFQCINLFKVGGYSRHYKFIKNKPIALPPFDEQKRIVAKIEELLPLVEQYEKTYNRLKQLNKQFPDDMKKSILQLAIQGKLVEQRPEEGTGEELYKQIQAEKAKLIKEGKIKKEKPMPPISEEEIPFEVPETWKPIRLGEVITLLSGADFPPQDYNSKGIGTPYMTGASNIIGTKLIINRWTEKPRCIARKGDLLVVCKGSGYGKTVICNYPEVHIARQFMSIAYSELLNLRYVEVLLQASFSVIKDSGKGVIPGIERNTILNLPVLLPPLVEQDRIVAKIEELLPLCDLLKEK